MTPRLHRGFSLLEVLVSVLILSISFLAGQRWQLRALAYQQFTYFNSHAVLLLAEALPRQVDSAALKKDLPKGQLQWRQDAVQVSWQSPYSLPALNCGQQRLCLSIRTSL